MKSPLIREKARQYWQLVKHFQNPLLALFARLGWLKLRYFEYRVRKDAIDYNMLARARGGDWILREVLVEETYRPILKLLPPRPLRVLDIGAHIGAFTVWLHRQHGVAEAFCFEPDPDSFALCEFNLYQNECENVHSHRQALGGSTREAEIWVDAQTSARNSLYERKTSSARRQKVQVIALQEWLKATEGAFDLLKMDCEGAEWEMVKVALDSFMRFPIIVAEVHGDPNGIRGMEDFAAALSHCGFQTVSCEGLYIGQRNSCLPSEDSGLSRMA